MSKNKKIVRQWIEGGGEHVYGPWDHGVSSVAPWALAAQYLDIQRNQTAGGWSTFWGHSFVTQKSRSPFVRTRSAPGCVRPRQPAGLTCPRQAGRSAHSVLSFFNYSVLFTDIKISGSAGRQAIGQSHAEFAPRYVRTRKGLFLPRFLTLSIHLPAVSYRHASTNFRFSPHVYLHPPPPILFYSGTWIC